MANPGRISAIVLAAGQSKRMGEDNKLLIELNGKTLLQHVLNNLHQSEVDEIFVVTGNQSEEIKTSIVDFNVQCIENDRYAEGLSSSIKLGIESLVENTDAVLICHGDMPFVGAITINMIINTFMESNQIILPTYMGQRGNPLLWPQKHFDKLTNLSGDSGAKKILKNHDDEILRLSVDDVGILLDIDDHPTLELICSKFDKNQEKRNAN